MNGKQVTFTASAIALLLQLAAFVKDEERYKANLARWHANPTGPNLVRLILAEGVLVKDLGWLL